MAKLKPARSKASAPPKPGAISCVVLLLIAFGLLGMLFYAIVTAAN